VFLLLGVVGRDSNPQSELSALQADDVGAD
jgi:hypothetical protein